MCPAPWRPPGIAGWTGFPVDLTLHGGGTLEEDRLQWDPCHRVIASEYAGESLFDQLTAGMDHFEAEEELEALREIADLTNPYVQHEVGAIELVPLSDRIYGPGSGLIMQAFTFPGKASRFSDGSRGTYYAAFDTDTAVTETRYHDEVFLQGSGACTLEKTLIHAFLDAVLLDLRSGRPCPPGIYDPNDYSASQGFGQLVRDLGGYGIAYDSVRHADGKCVAIFRPLVLQNAQAVRTLLYEWDGTTISVK